MDIKTSTDVKYIFNVKILAFWKTILQVCLEWSSLKKVKGRDFGAVEIFLKLIDTELCFGLASVKYGDVRELPKSWAAFWKPGF